MGYYTHNKREGMLRLTLELHTSWTEQPDAEELQKPVAEGAPTPTAVDREAWATTARMETSSRQVMAGALRSIANELDPPKPTTRGYDA